jgi:hypothetical protein
MVPTGALQAVDDRSDHASDSLPWWIVVIAAAAVVAILCVAVAVVRRGRKSAQPSTGFSNPIYDDRPGGGAGGDDRVNGVVSNPTYDVMGFGDAIGGGGCVQVGAYCVPMDVGTPGAGTAVVDVTDQSAYSYPEGGSPGGGVDDRQAYASVLPLAFSVLGKHAVDEAAHSETTHPEPGTAGEGPTATQPEDSRA